MLYWEVFVKDMHCMIYCGIWYMTCIQQNRISFADQLLLRPAKIEADPTFDVTFSESFIWHLCQGEILLILTEISTARVLDFPPFLLFP